MSDNLISPEEAAVRLRLKDADQVLRIAREQDWPRVVLTGKTIRFTESDIAEIIRRSRKVADKQHGLPGQTARSKARAS